MKESYNKGVANHVGPESCLDDPRGRGEALTGGSAGGLSSSENTFEQRGSCPGGAGGGKDSNQEELETRSRRPDTKSEICVERIVSGASKSRSR